MLVKTSILIVAVSSLVNASLVPRLGPVSFHEVVKRQGNCQRAGWRSCPGKDFCAAVGEQCCEDGTAPASSTCCEGGGACSAGSRCALGDNGEMGCCPVHVQSCVGPGGSETNSVTRSYTDTLTDTIVASATASASNAATSAVAPSASASYAASSAVAPSASASGKKQCTPKKKK